MKKLFLLLFYSIFLFLTCYCQNLDSLIASRKTDVITGKVLTYYSTGNKKIALQYQILVSAAESYYEKFYGKRFTLKLAVLDSAQWLTEETPYGFVFYDRGWMVMNTGMSYPSFKRVYGLESFSTELDSALTANHTTPGQLIHAMYEVYCIHEVGHYFFDSLSKGKAPDNWINESIATYFSCQYFKNNNQSPLHIFELFCKIDRDYYKPKHTSIEDLDAIYANMGVQNYLWYHSNFYFLVKSLYKCYGTRFISAFENLFPKADTEKISKKEIIKRFDRDCKGVVGKWVNELENFPQTH